MNDKSRELYERNALGNIVSHLFPGYGEFYAVPWTAKKEIFELLSVFVKNGCDTTLEVYVRMGESWRKRRVTYCMF